MIYKVPWHIRQYVKQELLDYKKNRKYIGDFNTSTRAIILAERRLRQIENVLEKLNQEDRDACEAIFFQQYTQVGAMLAKGITKAMYYNTMNKVIYLVAREMELI